MRAKVGTSYPLLTLGRNPGWEEEHPVTHVFRRSPLSVLALAAAALALAGGFAYGAIPDANGVYTACAHSTTGALRLIDPSTGGACHSTESQVTWGKQG